LGAQIVKLVGVYYNLAVAWLTMPSVSVTLPSREDRDVVKKYVPKPNKIFMATVARLYVAYPDPNAWTYTNIMGAVVLVEDSKKQSLFFKIVDVLTNGGLLWEQELYEDFVYNKERPFFHTFMTDDYYAAFSFADDNEANDFYSKVEKHIAKRVKQKKEKKPKKKEKNGKVTTSMISGPTNFRHLEHIGWNADSGFNAQNINPEWNRILNSLGDLGVSKSVIEENMEDIMNFVKSNGGAKKVTSPSKSPTRSANSKKVPPTLPPPKQKRPISVKSKEKPPPPPVPVRKSTVSPTSRDDSLSTPPIVPRKNVPSISTHDSSPSPPPKVPRKNVPSIASDDSQPSPPIVPRKNIPSISSDDSSPPLPPIVPKKIIPSPSPLKQVTSQPKQIPTSQPSTHHNYSRQPSPPPVAPIIQKSKQPSPPPVQFAPPPPPPPVRTVTAPPPLPPARVVSSLTKPEVLEAPPLPPARNTQAEIPTKNYSSPPPSSEGRFDLLAQIRSVGGVSGAGLKPVNQNPPSRQSTLSEEPSSPTSGGNDLLKTLATALMTRQQALNDDSGEHSLIPSCIHNTCRKT
ncbi:5172_t:CDS:10, partial [Acaulospora morrowiae]